MNGPFSRAGYAFAENAGLGEVLAFRRPPFGERVRLSLRRHFAVAGEGFPELCHQDYRLIGRRLRRETRLPVGVDPRWYCLEIGLHFVAEPETRGCGGELYLPSPPPPIVLYRPSIDPAAVGFSVTHGLTHHLLGQAPHVDIILASFEIMCPAEELMEDGIEKFKSRQMHAPAWCIEEYYRALNEGWIR